MIVILLMLINLSFSKKEVKTDELANSLLLNLRNDSLNQKHELNEMINEKNSLILERIHFLNEHLNKTMYENNIKLENNIQTFKYELKKEMINDFESLNDKVDKKLNMINEKVEERLMTGFKESGEIFKNVLERLNKIDEAQKNIESLSNDVVSLQNVLTDKKTRGIFGEVQLYQILASVFGEKNDAIYQRQYKLSNGKIADSIVFTPEPMGNIVIDSKFPLENYQNMASSDNDLDREKYAKEFKNDVKKHIKTIAEKYIIKNETSNQAILFLPAEAIFAQINAYHYDLVQYSADNNVWLASPTTLMAVLKTIQVVLINIERDKNTKIIHQELEKLSIEFNRYASRWQALEKDITKVYKDVQDISVTSNKIGKKFEKIHQVEIEEE